MARISTYNLDDGISVNDLLLGSSYEGTNNGNPIYKTRNYRLSDLAQFFENYDFTNNISLTELDNRLSVVEGYGNHATAGYLTAHPNITAASSVDNSGQFFIQDITLDSNGHILSITSAEATGGGSSTDLTSFQVLTNAAGTASLSYNNTTGDFTYTPPDLSSYLTSVAFSDLTSTPTTISGYGITDAFDGAYGSLTGTPDIYTETEIDGFFAGTSAITGYSKTNWDSAYNNSIASMTVTGTSTKTITLNQQDGGTVTATFTDISETGQGNITDTNDYVTSGSFTNGTLTLQVPNQSNVNITGFDSRYYTETEVDNLIANYITLTSISTNNLTSPSGDGSISYNSGTGVITYTPPDFSGSYLSTSGGTITGNLTVNGIINVNSATGTSNFINDVSIDGDLSVDGAFTISTVTGDLRGDVYSIVGATSSVKVLESGSGNTPDTYYIGDLRNSDTDQVFDTSLAMFRKDVRIGDVANDLGGGAENLSLTLGATSKLYFADGAGPTHSSNPYTYIDATKVSNWDFSVLTSSKFQMGQTTGSPQEDLIQFNINGASGLTSSLSIKPGTYISASTDTDNHVLLDVNNTSLANLYVGKTGGQSMQGPLSITAGNLTVSGNGTFIEGDGKIDIYNTSTTPVKILDHINAWFRGDVRGGDLQDVDGNDLFAFTQDTNDNTRDIATLSADLDMTGSYTDGGSNAAYRDILLNQGSLIKFGNQSTEINGTSVGNWNSAYGSYVRDLDFYSSSTNNYGISITGDGSGNYDRDIADIIGQGTAITMSAANGKLTIGATVRNLQSTPITDGLAYYSDITNYFASNNTTIGWVIGGQTTTPDKVNLLLEAEDGLVFVHTADDGTQGYDNFVIRNSKGVESFAINDSTGVLTITKTGAGGTPGTLTANLQTYVDSRVSAGAAPSLQSVLDSSASGNNSTTEIRLSSSATTNSDVNDHGLLLARRNETTGDNLIATFDTFGSSGHIRIGSDGSGNDNTVTYGYLGMASNGNLFLSNASSTSGGVIIDSSDNVGIGAINNTYKFNVNGSARFSNTLLVEALTSLQQGVNISNGAFQVANTTGNTTLTGTLDVSGDTSLDITRIDGALTVANASNFQNVVTLESNLLPDTTANNRNIGASSAKFNKVYTNNLNDTPTSDLANKTQATTFYDGSAYKNVTAADFILASDINLKENIIPLSNRKIDVEFKEYNFKGSKRTRFGVIAQDIEEKHPEFVHAREGGDKTVSYIDLLVAKVHELENRIKELESVSTR